MVPDYFEIPGLSQRVSNYLIPKVNQLADKAGVIVKPDTTEDGDCFCISFPSESPNEGTKKAFGRFLRNINGELCSVDTDNERIQAIDKCVNEYNRELTDYYRYVEEEMIGVQANLITNPALDRIRSSLPEYVVFIGQHGEQGPYSDALTATSEAAKLFIRGNQNPHLQFHLGVKVGGQVTHRIGLTF